MSGYDFVFNLDRNLNEVIVSTTASEHLTTTAPSNTNYYKALHIQYLVICPRNRGHRAEALDAILDYGMLGQLLSQLPHLEKVVVAFEDSCTDEMRASLSQHLSIISSAGKLCFVRADRDIKDAACKWIVEDPGTLRPTGTRILASLWQL